MGISPLRLSKLAVSMSLLLRGSALVTTFASSIQMTPLIVSADFIEDVDLIFDNCHVYNDPRSNIARTAATLRAFFESKLEARKLSGYRVDAAASKNKKRRTN